VIGIAENVPVTDNITVSAVFFDLRLESSSELAVAGAQGQPETDIISADGGTVVVVLQGKRKKASKVFLPVGSHAPWPVVSSRFPKGCRQHQITPGFGHHPANVKGDQIVELAERRIRGGDCAILRTHQMLSIVFARSRGRSDACYAGRSTGGQQLSSIHALYSSSWNRTSHDPANRPFQTNCLRPGQEWERAISIAGNYPIELLGRYTGLASITLTEPRVRTTAVNSNPAAERRSWNPDLVRTTASAAIYAEHE